MKTHRLARIAEVIREVTAETILFELRDPRVRMTTVTRAEVSGDLQSAKIYVSIMGTESQQQRTLKALQHAAGFVQSRLAKRLQTRFLPVLKFVLDEGIKNSLEITRLINEALGKDSPENPVSPESPDEPEVAETSANSVDEAIPDEAVPDVVADGSVPTPAQETRS